MNWKKLLIGVVAVVCVWLPLAGFGGSEVADAAGDLEDDEGADPREDPADLEREEPDREEGPVADRVEEALRVAEEHPPHPGQLVGEEPELEALRLGRVEGERTGGTRRLGHPSGASGRCSFRKSRTFTSPVRRFAGRSQPWPSSSNQTTSWCFPSISSASIIRSLISGTTRRSFRPWRMRSGASIRSAR